MKLRGRHGNSRRSHPRGRRTPVPVEISLRSVVRAVGVAVVLWLAVLLRDVLLLIAISLVVAGTLSPGVAALERRGVSRSGALLGVCLLLLLALAGAGLLIAPALVAQIRALVDAAPELQNRAANALAATQLLRGPADALRKATPEGFIARAAPPAIAAIQAAMTFGALAVTAVVLGFYFIAEREEAVQLLAILVPQRYHVRGARLLRDLQHVVGGYVRGQVITSILMTIVVYITLSIAGAPEPLALAVFAGLADLLPYFGGYILLAPAVLATLVRGVVSALLVAVTIVSYQEFESRILVPRVYGRVLRLAPAAVIVSLLIGYRLLGITGALLALPVAAGIRVLVRDLRLPLPGGTPGSPAERRAMRQAEARYARRRPEHDALEATRLATTLAEQVEHRPASAERDEPTGAGGADPPSSA